MLILNSPYDLPDVNATMENSSEIQIKSIQDTDVDEFGVHTLYLETNGTAYTRTGNEQKIVLYRLYLEMILDYIIRNYRNQLLMLRDRQIEH